VKKFPYRQVVGSLLYLAVWTRPDLQYAIISLAKHSHRPTIQAVRACQWLLEYLNGSKDRGLEFHKGLIELSAFCDASFGDDTETGRSTLGHIIYLGTSPISWASFLANTTVQLSTAEAEYVSASHCAKVLCAHNNLLTELGYPQSRIMMYEDNQAAITIALQRASTHRTRHILIQIHHIRALIVDNFIEMVHINTILQLGDAFTKPLGFQALEPHLDTLFGKPPTGRLQKYIQTTLQLRRSGRSILSSQPLVQYPTNTWKLYDNEGF